MKGIFVRDSGGVDYAVAIVRGEKIIETRRKNMLGGLVGERVAIVRTRRGKRPTVVGYARVSDARYCPADAFGIYRDLTLVPEGSEYDCADGGAWFYGMICTSPCDPYPLPGNAVRHGRSWCEWEEN